MNDVAEILASTPWLLATFVFVLGLLVGSFLNVVIHRLPIMMEREWQAQAQEIVKEAAQGSAVPVATSVAGQHSEILDDAVLAGVVDIDTDATAATSGHVADAPGDAAADVDAFTDSPDRAAAHDELVASAPATDGATGATAAAEPYNLVVPRSRCPKCNAEITALQNIPVLSWLALGGKCANCRAPISARYPVVEFATAVLSTAVALRFGWHWQLLFALVFTWALVALTVIDIDHTLLPDAITIPLLWLGLLLSVFWHAGLRPPAPTDPTSAILGAVFGYLALWSVYWVFKLVTGKEGMGHGDFKLLGALGAWMGWQMLPLVLLLSAAAGAIVGIMLIVLRGRDRNVPMPFGPYLAVAGWIALMWGPQIAHGYMTVTGLGN